jgi:hypothetical protein
VNSGSAPLPLTSSAPNSSSAAGLPIEKAGSDRADRNVDDARVRVMVAVDSSVASQEEYRLSPSSSSSFSA